MSFLTDFLATQASPYVCCSRQVQILIMHPLVLISFQNKSWLYVNLLIVNFYAMTSRFCFLSTVSIILVYQITETRSL